MRTIPPSAAEVSPGTWPHADSATRYGTVSRVLHWTMALCFAIVFTAATVHFVDRESALAELVWPVHRPTGALLMLLVVLRAAWALLHAGRRPPHINRAAHFGHLALYALMFTVPCLGLLRQYAQGRAFAPFGIPLMQARPDDKIDWAIALGNLLHGEIGWVLLACVAGHVFMALWHRRSGHQDVLPRMIGK
jgi:cytochrome b561